MMIRGSETSTFTFGVTRLAVIAALAGLPPGCGGDPTTTTDGGIPGADAPIGDRDSGPGPVACTGVAARSFTVDVISSPARITPPTPLEGASVRVEHPCGASVEGHTGADGSVTLMVEGPASGWTVTAARRGLSATSVADLDGSPTGPLRIDPLDDATASLARQTVSGTVTGAASGALVSIDAYDFDTIGFAPTTGTFSTGFYVGTSSPPLELVALEQVGGSLTRIARSTAMSPRPTTPVTGVALDFTGAPLTPVRTTHTIRGATGATIMAYTPLTYAAEVDAAWVQAGVATAGSAGGSPTVTIEHLPGLVPDLVIAAGELVPGGWTQVAIHDFDGAPHDVTIGAVTMIPEIVGRGVAGTGDYDTLVLYVDETESHASRWRLYCSAELHDRTNPCAVPSLPSDVSLSDLRLAPGASSLGVLVTMHEGSAWSTAVTNFASANIDHQIAGRYTPLPL